MYLDHFGLNQQPFSMTPDPSFFFAGNKRGEILDALIYAVLNGDGIIKVTGEVGCGKTMLCRMLESRLPDHVEVIYLINPTLSREQVIFTIAGELELPINGKRVDEVIRLLHTALISKHIDGKQVVLLIEEAQAMSLSTLEEIRLFSNLETAHHKLLQIVLFGQPELDDHLNVPAIRQLKERISNSFKVPPLNSEAVAAYLRFRLRAAGYRGPDLFSKRAVSLISQVSKGVVRRIGILADKSLLAAFADNAASVGLRHVRAAVADSEFSNRGLPINRPLAAMICTLVLVVTIGCAWYLSAMNSAKASTTSIKTATVMPLALKTPAAKPDPVPIKTLPAVAKTALPTLPVTPAVSKELVTIPVEKLSAPISLDERLERTTQWLNEQSPDKFSIQIALISSGDRANVTRQLHKLESESSLDDVHVYGAEGDHHFGIIIGSYGNRTDAEKMISQLETRWGYHPQLRTVGGIRKEIHKA